MAPYFRLLRPKQWIKGFVVFAAILFTDPLNNPEGWRVSLLAFLIFGLVGSATYIVNDTLDAPQDRLHPKKKFRPIASGEVKVPIALALAVVLTLVAFGLLTMLPPLATVIIVLYIAIQAAYNLVLKSQPIADVFCLSSGFVLRAAIGAAAMNVEVSSWLLYCTFSLALMLGFGKRRGERILMGDSASSTRTSLGAYNLRFLDTAVVVCAAASLLGYGVYCIESQTAMDHPLLKFTYLWVAFAVFRFLFLTFTENDGAEPENLFLKDIPMITAVVLFGLTALFAMVSPRLGDFGPKVGQVSGGSR